MHSEFTREDYEHAARAAGLKVWKFQNDSVRHGILLADRLSPWNPPYDYGDALRLSEAAGIDLHYDHSTAICTATNPVSGRGFSDRLAPVAIFRAAIEIGKSMKGTP